MKPKTFIIDIDGVIFKHFGLGGGAQWHVKYYNVLHHAQARLEGWEAEGSYIVLMTARPEHLRKLTEEWLAAFCIPYHQLVMGVTSGTRVLINDSKGEGKPTSALAFCVERNGNLSEVPYDID